MARNRVKDNEYFNCSQDHEKRYVAGLYTNHTKVYDLLTRKCGDRTIHNFTHYRVFILIKQELGYEIPD